MKGLTIGRVVFYRSRTGLYTCPAMITATRLTLHRPNVEAGFIPDLSSDTHVHLTVFTPGAPGKRATAEDFVARADAPIAENVGGLYQEWDVPFDEATAEEGFRLLAHQQAGPWGWPLQA